jgi:hypothetical protein
VIVISVEIHAHECFDCRCLIAGLRVDQCHMVTFTTLLRIKSCLSRIFLVILLQRVLIRPMGGKILLCFVFTLGKLDVLR